jgi:uncharacterized protein
MTAVLVNPARLCQIEIQVSDLARAVNFYSEALGWRPVPAEMHELVVLEVPPDCAFGISLRPSRKSPKSENNLVPYFAVDDAEAVLCQVEAHGGRRIIGPTKLPGYGTIYQCEDPDGTRIGLYTKI